MKRLEVYLKKWQQILIITGLVRLFIYFLSLSNLSPQQNFFYIWNRWDSFWYLTIAQNWYLTSGKESLAIVFYPLYPIFIKLFSLFVFNIELAGLLVSLIFSFTSAILLYEVTLLDYDKKTALKAVWFLNIFPTSFFLQAIYPESLFLTLSLFTILSFRKKHFLSSGLYGLLSSLTRVNGILLTSLILFEPQTIKNKLKTLTLIPIGFLIYLLINYLIFNSPFHFSTVLESNWYKHFDWPWNGINQLVTRTLEIDPNFQIYLAEVISLVILLIISIYTVLKIRLSYGIYMLTNLFVFASTSFILSTPRYILILFPIYLTFAKFKNKFILTILSIIFLGLLVHYTVSFTDQRWAF